ncbi:MspA protein, partial [Mycobacterium sp. ITM-2017-0098]
MPVASAEPDGEPVVAAAPPNDAGPPAVETAELAGAVVSPPPAVTTSPDGWTLTVAAKDETQL